MARADNVVRKADNRGPPCRLDMVTYMARKRGRPPKAIDLDLLRRHAATGMNAAQISTCLGISRRALFAKLAQDRAVRNARHAGLVDAVAAAALRLARLATAGNADARKAFLKMLLRDGPPLPLRLED
jgi:hypothetical protein